MKRKHIIQSFVILLLLSCKSENLTDQSSGVIQIGVSEVSYESEESFASRAATPLLYGTFSENTIQSSTTVLNDDFLMVAEMHPVQPVPTNLKNQSKAALDTTDLDTDFRYRLLVYNQAGAFVEERDYIRGQEASTAELSLTSGTYTFVVFSFNTAADNLPTVTPAAATRTLSNSRITTPNTGRSDFMYYKHTMAVSSSSLNRLDIILKHRKPSITLTINSSETGYNITAIDAEFKPHNAGMTANLSDGSYSQTGTVSQADITFSGLNSQNIVGAPAILNAVSNQSTSLTLNSITIGPLTLSNLTPFTNLRSTPGVKYNLILNIVPRDGYVVRQSVPSVRINGRIWALHNLGVDTTLNPNPSTITSALHGNYYQFGRNRITAAPTANGVNSNFSTTRAAANAWNEGTETSVQKSDANDPCPAGFRLPTRTNLQSLLNGTVFTEKGSFTDSNTNFASAAVLTSKRKSDVVIVLPAQGFMNLTGTTPPVSTGIASRGNSVQLWSSSSDDDQGYRLIISTATQAVTIPVGNNTFVQSRPIRCTATLATDVIPQS